MAHIVWLISKALVNRLKAALRGGIDSGQPFSAWHSINIACLSFGTLFLDKLGGILGKTRQRIHFQPSWSSSYPKKEVLQSFWWGNLLMISKGHLNAVLCVQQDGFYTASLPDAANWADIYQATHMGWVRIIAKAARQGGCIICECIHFLTSNVVIITVTLQDSRSRILKEKAFHRFLHAWVII